MKTKYEIWGRVPGAPSAKLKELTTVREGRAKRQLATFEDDNKPSMPPGTEFELREVIK